MATGDPLVWCLHCKNESHDKFYAVAVLHTPGSRHSVQAWWGRATASTAQASKVYHTNLMSTSQAQAYVLGMLSKKMKEGYVDVTFVNYHWGLSEADIQAKIDMTYVVRPGVPSPFAVPGTPPPKPKPVVSLPLHADPVTDRNRRVVDV